MSRPAPSVLIVDDEPMLVHVLVRLLRRDGVTAVGATNGLEALQALRDKRFDLVLCDVRMPVMDGPTALREAAATGERIPPWVFLTGYADTADAALRELGACAVYGKPIDVATLRGIVETWTRP